MREGYHLESSPPRFFAVTASVQVLLGPNPKRNSIILSINSPAQAGSVCVWPGDGQLTGNTGFTINGNPSVVILGYSMVGPAIFLGWSCFLASGGSTITVMETFLAEGD